jgi:polyisoprenyl-teichoic acid--peptidoglycan teichoic acid transferase
LAARSIPAPPQHENLVSRDRHDDVPYDRELIRSGGVPVGQAKREQPKPPRTSRAERREQARAPRRSEARGRPRRRSLGRTIGLVLFLLLVAVVVGVVLLGFRAAAFNAEVSTAGFPSTALLGKLNGSERVNVLLVGYGGGDHDGAYLADSIQILSVDPSTDRTTTVPIPRDLWIEGVASYPQNGKVNEVFQTGFNEGGLERGGALLAEVLSDVTGLQVEHWLSIDFAGFREMVDAVGGVTIDNPVAFSYTTSGAQHNAGNWSSGSFEAGELHLDGDRALAYSRARFTNVVAESTDFARSVRQARVLSALRRDIGDGGLGSILPGLGLMDAMEGRVLTDLSVIDLFLLSSHLSSDCRVEITDGTILSPLTNTIGQYILIPRDWAGPGSYGGFRAFIADELPCPVEEPAGTDAP